MKILRHVSLRTVLAYAAIILGAFSLGWYTSRAQTLQASNRNVAQPVRYKDPEFPLINPLVSIALPNAVGFPELKNVKNDVANIIDAAKNTGDVQDVGVYFRLPGNAHWFGVNENTKFDPGSLIKVPILLAYLKETESDPAILSRRYFYDPRQNNALPDSLPSQYKAGSYDVRKLLETMIVDSDNVSKDVLTDHLPLPALQDVFDEVNLNFLTDPAGTISPKSYVIILARIYSATYLNRYYSNYAMGLLSKTTFKDGLVAGLPVGVPVAHKYGERGIYEEKIRTGVELHDCGLVYATDAPYYLCVMTKGKDPAVLADVIQRISSVVYQDRASFKPSP